MDKLIEFRVKIGNKNQLRYLLKQKKELYEVCLQNHEMDCEKLHEEIVAIELRLKDL